MKSIEVLVASMVEKPSTLIEKMNIRSNAVISNQFEKFSYEEITLYGNNIKIIDTHMRGVGKNRNLALDFAEGDICILADDDEIFFDDYQEKILKAYESIKDADVIIFNLIEKESKRYRISKTHRIRFYNFMRYGAARVSFKRRAITKNGIHFNVHFGGGTEHSAGEDVLFLHDCLSKGLNIYAVDIDIAKLVDDRESTWFVGHNEKFFRDKGVLFATLSNRLAYFYCLQFLLRHSKIYKNKYSFKETFTFMSEGVKNYRNSINYN